MALITTGIDRLHPCLSFPSIDIDAALRRSRSHTHRSSSSALQKIDHWAQAPRSKCIIYLEPREGTPLHTAISEFFSSSKALVGATEAHQYQVHCSMTGFFDAAGRDIVKLVRQINSAVVRSKASAPKEPSSVYPAVRTVSTAHDYPHKGTHKIELLLKTPRPFLDLIAGLVRDNPAVHIRPKKIDHISLAYYNKHLATARKLTDREASVLDSLARSFLYSPELFDVEKNQWDIAFYQLKTKSHVLDVPHTFVEIARWQL